MTQKQARHRTILELIAAHAISSQEELRLLLGATDLQITQATLSRDLRQLGVVRAPTAEGVRYRLANQVRDEAKPSLQGLLPQLFSSVDGVGEMIVLRTLPGGAQPIAEAIDGQHWPEVLGTLAGENTVLVVCRSAGARVVLTGRLEQIAARE